MRRVRGQSIKDDVIVEADFDDLKGFVSPKAIADKYPWLPISTSFSLRIKNSFNPPQANKRVIVTCFRKSIEPSQSRVCRSVPPVSRCRPDNHRIEILTAC